MTSPIKPRSWPLPENDSAHCNHPTWSKTFKFDNGGARRFLWQCHTCGDEQGMPKGHPDRATALDQYDPNLCEIWYKPIRDAWEQWRDKNKERLPALLTPEQREEANRRWWRQYNGYLETPEWARRRAKVFERAGRLCEACRDAPATEVHHLTYDHVFDEPLFDLAAVCHDCHETITRLDRERRGTTAW